MLYVDSGVGVRLVLAWHIYAKQTGEERTKNITDKSTFDDIKNETNYIQPN